MSYTFRIRFNQSPHNTIQSEASELTVPVPDCRVLLVLRALQANQPIRDADQLALIGDGYDSEKEATEAGLRFQNALMVALARVRVGADFGQRAAKGAFTEYGLKWVEGEIGQRAINNVHGLMVFPSVPKPSFVSMKAGFSRGASPDAFQEALLASIALEPFLGDRDLVSYSLFNASFFQPTSDSRFLLLVMAVEALIEPASRSPEARGHVDGLIAQTRSASLSEGEKNSMIEVLRWLRQESINQAGRRLTSSRLGGRSYSDRSAPDFFSYCYQLRSDLVHGNVPFPTFEKVGNAAGTLEVFVADLLTSPILR